MPNIGPLELVVLLVIVLLIFGPKRLPGLGRQLGSGMREFKDSVTGNTKPEPTQTSQLPVGTQDTTAQAPARENETVS